MYDLWHHILGYHSGDSKEYCLVTRDHIVRFDTPKVSMLKHL